jgi:rare lipoprotein A
LKHPHRKSLTGVFACALSFAGSIPSFAHPHHGSTAHSSDHRSHVSRLESLRANLLADPLSSSSGHPIGATGMASVYSGRNTASGEHSKSGAMTAAHRTLPFGTMVTVTNEHTGSTVVVRINDRGPFVRGRIIDLSPAAARAIGVSGVSPVSLKVGDLPGKRVQATNDNQASTTPENDNTPALASTTTTTSSTP